jgi:hypothetical protein
MGVMSDRAIKRFQNSLVGLGDRRSTATRPLALPPFSQVCKQLQKLTIVESRLSSPLTDLRAGWQDA